MFNVSIIFHIHDHTWNAMVEMLVSGFLRPSELLYPYSNKKIAWTAWTQTQMDPV